MPTNMVDGYVRRDSNVGSQEDRESRLSSTRWCVYAIYCFSQQRLLKLNTTLVRTWV